MFVNPSDDGPTWSKIKLWRKCMQSYLQAIITIVPICG